MFFRLVTALALVCTVGASGSHLCAEGFWDLQTLADDADTAYGAPPYNARATKAPSYYVPTHSAPTCNGPACRPPATTNRPAANPVPTPYVDYWQSIEPVEAAPGNGMNSWGDIPPPPDSEFPAYTRPHHAVPTPSPAPPEPVVEVPTQPAPACPPSTPARAAPASIFPAPAPAGEHTSPSSVGQATAGLDGKALADAIYGVGACSVNPQWGVLQPVVRNSCWGQSSCWGQRAVGPKIGRFYGGLEYVHWWTRGQRLPVLVTSSPAGTPDFEAGVWGYPATEIIYGGQRRDTDDHSGGRFQLGLNLDCEGCNRVEAEYFLMDEGRFYFAASAPDDYSILARPFYNTLLDQEDSELVGYPGIVDGTLAVRGTTNFDGLGVWLRHNLFHNRATGDPCATASCGSGMMFGNPGLCGAGACGARRAGAGRRLDLIVGYRRLNLDENLYINEYLTSTDPGGPIALGTTLDIQDRFHTENEFHGGDFGLDWEWSSGCWGVGALFKCAIGSVTQRVCINGSTTVTPPAGAAVYNDGGLLALDSNSGNYERDEFTVIPEVGLDVYYRLNCHVRIKVGYTLIYFSNVLRPGDLMDTNVDPQQLPPPLITDGKFPELKFYEDDFWAQGLRLGAEFTF